MVRGAAEARFRKRSSLSDFCAPASVPPRSGRFYLPVGGAGGAGVGVSHGVGEPIGRLVG